MKNNVIKTAFAAVCVVAARMGGMKAYNVANQSEADMLLSENVEALSQSNEDNSIDATQCGYYCCEVCRINEGLHSLKEYDN